MAQIKTFALGGLDEIGKNCFVVEVEQDIFIFDCGIKILKEIDLGINALIPDFKYLVKNQNRIKGIFITRIDLGTAHALKFLLAKISHLKIYMSAISQEIVKREAIINSHQIKDNLFLIESFPLLFGKNKISAFRTATNLPGSIGFSLETEDGYILYTGAYILEMDNNDNLFQTDLEKVILNKQKSVLLMISSVAEITTPHFVAPYHQVTKWLKASLDKVSRNLFLCCDQNDWYKIFSCLKLINQEYPNQFFISFWDQRFGESFLEITNKYSKKKKLTNYLDFNFLKRKLTDKKIIFITGNQKWLFSRILQLVNTNQEHLKLTEKDAILILGENYFNGELSITKILNSLYTKDANINFINNKKILPLEASQQDLKLFFQLFSPHYFFPINNYYQNLEKTKILFSSSFHPDFQVLVKNNGEIVTFQNGKIENNKHQYLEVNSVFIDNLANQNIASSVIQERKILAQEGCLIISFAYQKNQQVYQLQSEIKITNFGLTSDLTKLTYLEKKITTHVKALFTKQKALLTDQEKLASHLKKEWEKLVKKELKKKPFIFNIIFFE